MLCATLLQNLGGIKTPIMLALVVIIALYLRYLSRCEKREAQAEPLTAQRLAELPDEQLVNAVVRALLAECDPANPDPYRMVAVWSNPQVNVYAVWVAVKEAEQAGLAGVKASPSARFLPLAADGFDQIGATDCAAVLRAILETPESVEDAAFAAVVAAEQPLERCVAYIRDNAEAFVK